MLRPSYSDLLYEINKGVDEGDVVGSRYTIVIAAAKRARQLVDHAQPLTENVKVDKPVSIAVNELYEGKIKIVQNNDVEVQAKNVVETNFEEEFLED